MWDWLRKCSLNKAISGVSYDSISDSTLLEWHVRQAFPGGGCLAAQIERIQEEAR